MYYFTKPPKAGEVEAVPAISETTPQFRDFEICNIVCDGAEKGIFIRGLPEMAVKNIRISQVVLNTSKGAEIIEAAGIPLSYVTLLSRQTAPVIYVENSIGVNIDNMKYRDGAAQLININGTRSKGITLRDTNTSKVKIASTFVSGSTADSITITE